MKIWGHTIVKNESRYLWFSVTSVIPYLDKLLLWDTGSTDDTPQIARVLVSRYPDKIEFREVGNVDPDKFTTIRAQMMNATSADWVIIVDGDEVWWRSSIKEVIETINEKGRNLDSIVVGYYNLLGDIYHHEDEKNGQYRIDDQIGHITIRAINLAISGLNVAKPHGQQGFFDGSGKLIQELPKSRRIIIPGKSYMHFTHLPRAMNLGEEINVPKRSSKIRNEIGEAFPLDFFYPEVFFDEYPPLIKSPWHVAPEDFRIRKLLYNPARSVKKFFVRKSGY